MYLKFVLLVFLSNICLVHLNNTEVFVSPVLSPNKRRASNTFSFAGKRYYVSTVFKANFYKAFQYCRQQGMHLLSINSQPENDRIGQFLQDNGQGSGHYWTSASNLGGDGQWIWLSTGQNIVYTNWYPGEPTSLSAQNSTEHCVEVRHWAQPSGFTWNDLDCSAELYFICETSYDCNDNPGHLQREIPDLEAIEEIEKNIKETNADQLILVVSTNRSTTAMPNGN